MTAVAARGRSVGARRQSAIASTTIGAAVPGLKKPMDFVEEHENKLSALVASPIVLLEVKRLLGLGFPALARAGDSLGSPVAGSGLALAATAEPLVGAAGFFVDLGLGILYLLTAIQRGTAPDTARAVDS